MNPFLHKLSDKIDKVSRFVIILLFALAFIGTVYQVFSRFILQSSFMKEALPMIDFSVFNFTWIEELIRYLFVWIVFLGIGMVYKSQGHARVELVMNYLPEKWKNRVAALIEVINSALFVFLMVYGFKILEITSQQISPSLGLNMTWIYGAILIGFTVCFVHSVTHFITLVSKKRQAEDENTGEKVITDNTNIG
ncbi:TRAP transporter small permease [Bacillus thermotolerans]|uniref:TRAP-type C4-dicarboxylate transport system, small permease component n=1 Tax=Bacillus thermotolerans TaxID=1221996 RepID=A0A0F5HSX1_BACTR|nr:TRAP transporter small permease [Bacillus thermotolerans]KKB35576.1 TRAP-type C4-dicarboxylate transport system, small permease component [Bacillus thermotolerans]KKB36100.1 TRAP-type C4-dicarboxylate transport system, small permease component [Bacillus thermotolerans]